MPDARNMAVRRKGVDAWNDEAVAQAWGPPPCTPERGFSVYIYIITHVRGQQDAVREAAVAVVQRATGRVRLKHGQVENAYCPCFIYNRWTAASWLTKRRLSLPGMNMGPSLDPVNQGHPSTSGLIEAIYEGNMETTRGAARCRLSSLRKRLAGGKEVTSTISHDRFLRRRARHCSSARGGSPSPSDGKRADFCLRCAVYLEGHPDDACQVVSRQDIRSADGGVQVGPE